MRSPRRAWTEGLEGLEPSVPEEGPALEELRELIQGLDESLVL